jgi:hypothetical protein
MLIKHVFALEKLAIAIYRCMLLSEPLVTSKLIKLLDASIFSHDHPF